MRKSAETALQAEPRRIQRLEVALCPARRTDPAPGGREGLGPMALLGIQPDPGPSLPSAEAVRALGGFFKIPLTPQTLFLSCSLDGMTGLHGARPGLRPSRSTRLSLERLNTAERVCMGSYMLCYSNGSYMPFL